MRLNITRRYALIAPLAIFGAARLSTPTRRPTLRPINAALGANNLSSTSTPRTWLSGYFGSGDTATRAAWASTYFPTEVWTSFTDFETTWALRAAHIKSNQSQYSTPNAVGLSLNILTIGLTLSGPGGSQKMNPATLEAAARGADTAGWTLIANALLATGLDSPSTILRIGHEPNGTWYPWSTGNDPTLMAYYRLAWQHAHQAVKAICPNVRFDLCFNVGLGGAESLAGHYPGDDCVDIIGLDFYDYALSKTSDEFTTAQGTLGFAAVVAFALQHHKKMALDEWAVSPRSDVTVRDNPFYVQFVADALVATQAQYPGLVSHDSYFNATDNHNLGVNPQASSTYRTSWVSDCR